MLHDVVEINQNTTNWASKLKDLLSTLEFYEVWLNQGVGNKNAFLFIFFLSLSIDFIWK